MKLTQKEFENKTLEYVDIISKSTLNSNVLIAMLFTPLFAIYVKLNGFDKTVSTFDSIMVAIKKLEED